MWAMLTISNLHRPISTLAVWLRDIWKISKQISKLFFQMNIQLILHEYYLLGQAKGGRMMFSGKGKEGAGWGYPQEYLIVIGD